MMLKNGQIYFKNLAVRTHLAIFQHYARKSEPTNEQANG